MSLISSASLWINEDSPLKKKSSMRKTAKIKPFSTFSEAEEYSNQDENFLKNPSISDVQQENEVRNTRVNELINQISADNVGDKLANYTPLPNPINDKITNLPVSNIPLPKIPTPKIPTPKLNSNIQINPYSTPAQTYSNYTASYKAPEKVIDDPDKKIMEKINYMIHLLEEQQNEKTNNITEEFILYTFLGVFVIYVVDSFARAGRYIR